MPSIPRVEKCCCCCSLNTGGLVLGWIGAIGSVIFILILSSTIFVDYDDYVKKTFIDNPEMIENLTKLKPLIYSAIVVTAIICIVHLVCSVLLIRGTLNRIAGYIKPWLVVEGIACVFSLIGLFGSLTDPGNFFSSLLSLAFTIYLWICIYSLYKYIQSEDYNQRQMAYNPGMQKV